MLCCRPGISCCYKRCESAHFDCQLHCTAVVEFFEHQPILCHHMHWMREGVSVEPLCVVLCRVRAMMFLQA